MKVYEIGFIDEDVEQYCIWIATDREITRPKTSKPDTTIKEIPEYNEETGGVDFIIK